MNDGIGRQTITEIEQMRSSRLVACIWGNRQPFYSQPAEDFVRPLMDQLDSLSFEKRKRIDLFLYGNGGTPELAWRVSNLLRQYGDEIHALVPYDIGGAVALLAAGSDRLIMGKFASISGLGIGRGMGRITGGLDVRDPVDGVAETEKIRRTLRQMLMARREKTSEIHLRGVVDSITGADVLTSDELGDCGLPLSPVKSEWEDSLWSLYKAYEESLKLRQPLHPSEELGDDDEKRLAELPLAVVETRDQIRAYSVDLVLQRTREALEDPVVRINLNMKAPAKSGQLISEGTAASSRLTSQLEKSIRQLVRREWARQTRETEVVLRVVKGQWTGSTQPL